MSDLVQKKYDEWLRQSGGGTLEAAFAAGFAIRQALGSTQERGEAVARDANEAVREVMEQAQVFASTWATVGGRFDTGHAMEDSEEAKEELRRMVQSLATLAADAHPPADAQRVAELEDAHLPFEWMEGCSFYLGEVREVFGATATVVHGDDETRILIGEVLECDFRKKSEAIGALRQELTERDARIAALEAQLTASREREGRMRASGEQLLDAIYEPPDANCSCHISPPCSDCVEYSYLRGAIRDFKAALAADKEKK